jgi:hypothetical protein
LKWPLVSERPLELARGRAAVGGAAIDDADRALAADGRRLRWPSDAIFGAAGIAVAGGAAEVAVAGGAGAGRALAVDVSEALGL